MSRSRFPGLDAEPPAVTLPARLGKGYLSYCQWPIGMTFLLSAFFRFPLVEASRICKLCFSDRRSGRRGKSVAGKGSFRSKARLSDNHAIQPRE